MLLPRTDRCNKIFSPAKRIIANAVTLATFVVLEFLFLTQNISMNTAALLLLIHFAVSNFILRKCVSSIPNDGCSFEIRTVAVNFFRESWGFAFVPMLPICFAIAGVGVFGKPVVAALIFGEGMLFCCFEGLALGFLIENAKIFARGSVGYFIASWLLYGLYYVSSFLPAIITLCKM